MSYDDQINEEKVDQIIFELLKLHSSSVIVDEENFLDLLKHSLSLSTAEKKKVVDAVPSLSQFQFDELTKVFVEEREKFRELATEHPDDIKNLLSKQQSEWKQLGDIYKMEKANAIKQDEDKSKINDIKASLGL